MPKSPNGFIPNGNQLSRTIVAPQRQIRLPQISQNGKIVQKASIKQNLPPITPTPAKKPIPKSNSITTHSKPKKSKQAPIKFELPPINMKKEKPLEEGFDHVISLGESYNNALQIEEAGLSNKTYVFDMISNLTLNKAPSLIHSKLNTHTLLMDYNIKTQKTRLHNLEIPHLTNEDDRNILKKLKKYYDMKLKELQAILLSGKRILFVHRATNSELKHKHYVHEFINQITQRYPSLDFHLLTCNFTNTTNTKHTNKFVKSTEEYIKYLRDNIRIAI